MAEFKEKALPLGQQLFQGFDAGRIVGHGRLEVVFFFILDGYICKTNYHEKCKEPINNPCLIVFDHHGKWRNFNQLQFLNDKEEVKGTHVFQLKENSNFPSSLNSSFLENQNASSTLFYNSPKNYIKVGLSPITTVIEYHHCTSFQRSSRGTFQNIGKYWVGQLGWNPIWPYHVTPGAKRSYTFDHLERV